MENKNNTTKGMVATTTNNTEYKEENKMANTNNTTKGMATENTSKIAEMANAEYGVWWGRMQEMVGSIAESRATEWQIASYWDAEEAWEFAWNTASEVLEQEMGTEEYEADPEWDTYTDLLAQTAMGILKDKCEYNEMANEEEECNMEMETMKRMAIEELGRTENTEGMADEEILELALSRATMEWSQLALEWIARKWSRIEDPDEENPDDVAGNIAAWQFGYRCEQEDQPTILLAWALHKENGGFDEDIRREIHDRIQRMADAVASGEEDWFSIVTSMECTEYELQEAHRIYDQKLLEVLKDHTIKNAKEILHMMWKDGESDTEEYSELEGAIERCGAGNATGKDWDLLVEQTEM